MSYGEKMREWERMNDEMEWAQQVRNAVQDKNREVLIELLQEGREYGYKCPYVLTSDEEMLNLINSFYNTGDTSEE